MDNSPNKNVFKSRFTNVSELTNGLKSEGLLTLEPNEKGPPVHIHMRQLEYFEVVSGELVVRIQGKNNTLKAGERIVINKAESHTYFNATNDKVTATFGYEPALNIQFLLDIFDSGDKKNGGNWNRFPILETGFVLYHFRKEYRLANLPFWLQDLVFGTLSKIAQITRIANKIDLPQNLLKK
jgi:mannose-6-phosphate isomerase-like protein (cupin superfamily)